MMFKMTTKRLAILSILLALGVVFKSVFSIGDGEFRISFFDIPLFLAGMIAGPFYGGLVALGTDLIYGLCLSFFFYYDVYNYYLGCKWWTFL